MCYSLIFDWSLSGGVWSECSRLNKLDHATTSLCRGEMLHLSSSVRVNECFEMSIFLSGL